jgi:predicted ATPase
MLVGGPTGPDARGAPTAVGAAAHLATRLLACADPMAVVVSADTRRLIGDLFECADPAPEALRGRNASIEAFRVVRESAIASRFDALRPHRTQLVGRDEELELLRRRWHQARTGKGRVVLVVGEPGIGKSRLVRALREELAAECHMPILYYCSPHHQDSALYPIARQLQQAAGIGPEDSAPTRLDKLVALLAQSTASAAEDVPLLAALLAIPADGRYPPLDLTPRRMKERTLEAILRGFKRLAEHRPVLLVFEDLQWVDPTSLELLSAAIDQASGLPLLVVATARPELVLPWAPHRHVSTIHLGRLGQSEGETLVKDVSGGKVLAPEVLGRIIAHADGVPLFIEELTKTVLESGILRDAGDRYELTEPLPQPAIPPTLYASLVARLDRLVSVKDVAQIGAAIGREFSYGLLAAVAPQPERELQEALQQLAKAELVFQRGAPPDARYLFKHALVQDAAYASLPRGRRQRLHDAIGHALEQRFSDVVAAEPEILAHHFSEAGLAERAISYWLKAGQLASARSANMEAVSHLKKGLALLPALPEEDLRLREELKLQCALGPALNATEGYAAELTLAAFERARALIAMTRDFSSLDFVMEGLTTAYYNGANYKECLRHREEFIEIAERDRNPLGLCIAHRGIASVHNIFANFELARAHAERAWGLYDAAKHGPLAWRYVRDVGVSALCHRAIAEWHLGHPERSRSLMTEGFSLAESSKHPNTIGYAHAWAAVLCFLGRDWAALQQHATTLTRLGHEQGFPQYVSWGTCFEAPPLAAAGYAEAAVERVQAGLALRERIQARALGPVFLYVLAESQHLAQRHAEALDVIAEAMTIADRTEERWIDAELWRLKGDAIGAADGRCAAPDAEQAYRQALVAASAQGTRMFALRAATSLACHLAATRRRPEGRELLAPLYAAFAEGFDTPDLKAARALLDRLA